MSLANSWVQDDINLKQIFKKKPNLFWYLKHVFPSIIVFNRKRREKIEQVFMAVEIDYLKEYFHTFPFTVQTA